MASQELSPKALARGSAWWLLTIPILAGLMAVVFKDGLSQMVAVWSREEYGHGYLIPAIAAFLVWRNRAAPDAHEGVGQWWGLLIVLVGLAAFFMGDLGTIYTVIQYAFLVTFFGVVLALCGWRFLRRHWAAMFYLVFMIPLPEFFYNGLSSQLQLISSELGVAVIRLFGISVFLDGNIIDLGVYKLQVVEACSGLRYLFPLMSFGYLCACLYSGPKWQKLLLFLSTIPVTVLMNSLRIGIIGVLVEFHGKEMAEGFLHQFEGWLIFMACVLILFAEVWLLTRLTAAGENVMDRFRLAAPDSHPGDFRWRFPAPPRAFFASLALIAAVALATSAVGARAEVSLQREAFVTFPMRVGDWRGRDQALAADFVAELKVDDYLLADFRQASATAPVNLYVAYYGSQRKGQAVHSPQSCIPGDGWQIDSFGPVSVDGIVVGGQAMQVNRAVIVKGDFRQLVYYWFPQRDRILTNEYSVKWFIFKDALLRNRTDGALVRLVTPIVGTQGMAAADRRLAEFTAEVVPALRPFFPR